MSTKEDIDEYGRAELHYVVIDEPVSKHETEIMRLFNQGMDINKQDNNGWSALHFAAQNQSVVAVKSLLKYGAKTELKDSFGNTPLFRAVYCSRGDGEIITLLLKHGANPDSENEYGVTPRSLASTIGNYDNAQFFT